MVALAFAGAVIPARAQASSIRPARAAARAPTRSTFGVERDVIAPRLRVKANDAATGTSSAGG